MGIGPEPKFPIRGGIDAVESRRGSLAAAFGDFSAHGTDPGKYVAQRRTALTAAYAALWWIPVGAGGHLVIHTSRWWEFIQARREGRAPQPLYHAALEVFVDGDRYLIEMAPAWGAPGSVRGVVATGPVGLALLGRLRLFRYEVRCWPDGILADRAWAVGEPRRFELTRAQAVGLLNQTANVPRLVWGRDVYAMGDMWNSNSLIAWLLHTTGIDAQNISPPGLGRAPGWATGIAAAEADGLRIE